MHFSITSYVFSGFTQKPKTFQPPSKGLNASSSKITSFYSFNDEERRFEETQGDCTSNLKGNNGCSGNDELKDYPEGSFLSGRGGDETRLDSCHAAVSRCLPGLPLRRRQVPLTYQNSIK